MQRRSPLPQPLREHVLSLAGQYAQRDGASRHATIYFCLAKGWRLQRRSKESPRRYSQLSVLSITWRATIAVSFVTKLRQTALHVSVNIHAPRLMAMPADNNSGERPSVSQIDKEQSHCKDDYEAGEVKAQDL